MTKAVKKIDYTDFVDNLINDYADQYALEETMALALFDLGDGFRLRVEHMDDDLLIDNDGRVIDLTDSVNPINGNLVWAATQSYQLVIGA